MAALIEEAAVYLQQHTGYQRFLALIRAKYETLGRLGGVIHMVQMSPEEMAIAAALDYRHYNQEEAEIRVIDFCQNFCTGRFSDLDFLEILAAYYGQPLLSRKAQKAAEMKERQQFFQTALDLCGDLLLKDWLSSAVLDGESMPLLLLQQYRQDQGILAGALQLADRALAAQRVRNWSAQPLAMLAAEVGRDPHCLDIGTLPNKLLLSAAAYWANLPLPQGIEAINSLLGSIGVMRDDISSTIVAYNLTGHGADGVAPWMAFWRQRQPLHLAYCNLQGIETLNGLQGDIYLVENPTVFMALLEAAQTADKTLLCTSGQLNTVALWVVDRLLKNGQRLHYSGDFDPEGLQIAAGLRKRAPEQIFYWRYGEADYQQALSGKSVTERLNKLDSITDPLLQPLCAALRRQKQAGYQEAIVPLLRADLLRA